MTATRRGDVKYASQTGRAPTAIFRGVIGQVLRESREAAGMTQEQVAAKARISREYVSGLERDVYRPTVEVFVRVCHAVGEKAWVVLRRAEERDA